MLKQRGRACDVGRAACKQLALTILQLTNIAVLATITCSVRLHVSKRFGQPVIAADLSDGLMTVQLCNDLTVSAMGLLTQVVLSARVSFGLEHKQLTTVLNNLPAIQAFDRAGDDFTGREAKRSQS